MLPNGEIFPLPRGYDLSKVNLPVSSVTFVWFKDGTAQSIMPYVPNQYEMAFAGREQENWKLLIRELLRRGLSMKDFKTPRQVLVSNSYNGEAAIFSLDESEELDRDRMQKHYAKLWDVPSVTIQMQEPKITEILDDNLPGEKMKVTPDLLRQLSQTP